VKAAEGVLDPLLTIDEIGAEQAVEEASSDLGTSSTDARLDASSRMSN